MLSCFDETLGAYQKLIKAGKVRVIGASNYTGERLASVLQVSKEAGLPAYQILQPEYNLYDRESYETNLEPVVEAHKLAVVTYFSLASGFLSGKDATGRKYDFTPSDLPILPGEVRDVLLTPSIGDNSATPSLAFPVAVQGTLEWANRSIPLDEQFK